ncbi:hypothetical protein EWB00_011407 [Schistosoma japonicum]|uniref:SJCHGC06191 protein n=1 Tax=Schistosoma japonicum TaxID=6182 RepID=Q5DBL8_SCHJA|nr:SJCHGC06191 protein [Schistosoma japonicum]KAH8873219.1 marvel-containing potential lipid raft-associated protein [Schistosoma japonicum]KAH8873220.1 marvel-containing potential lipid raft-associated protein [Schistosoma japonicum]TNN17052.1 hypothetical protein EWB00_011407 [Schistosoma japonicum]
MDRAPAAYETTYETRYETTDVSSVINVGFVRSLSGILKLCQILLSCIVLICVAATTAWSIYPSGGWVNFVASVTLICASVFYIFYLFNLIRKLPGPWIIIEFSVLLICTFFWFITLIVAAANNGKGSGAIAAAVFSAVALGVYITELATRFRCERRGNGFIITMTGVMTTHATRAPPTFAHSAPAHMSGESTDPHIGFSGAYAPGERADEGYVMP